MPDNVAIEPRNNEALMLKSHRSNTMEVQSWFGAACQLMACKTRFVLKVTCIKNSVTIKRLEHVDVMMMFIDKLEGAAYRHPR